MLGFPKSLIVNYVVRKVKKMVPALHELPGAVRFNDALSQGAGRPSRRRRSARTTSRCCSTPAAPPASAGRGAAAPQPRANILQAEAWYQPALKKIPKGEQIFTVCALPLYHIFGFNTNMMLSMRMGGCNILIANPRDLPTMFVDLAREKFHSFPAVNTLFNAMANHAEFNSVDWSHLVISVGGGMAVQSATAKLWLEKTGCPIVEGYGHVGDLALGHLQPGGQHRLQRQHRPADAQHRADAARRRRQRSRRGPARRDRDPRPAGDGRLTGSAPTRRPR